MTTRKQAIDFVTSGSYKRDLTYSGDYDGTQNTEHELEELATAVLADTQDELYSWIRYQGYVISEGTSVAFEYAVVKCLSTDSLQDLNDDAVVELLQKEGKLFTRGWVVQSPYGHPKKMSFEFFNVKLKAGEELRLIVRPQLTWADAFRFSDLEYRKVGA